MREAAPGGGSGALCVPRRGGESGGRRGACLLLWFVGELRDEEGRSG